ncbi:MAG: membrane dipeptidase [Chloroflexi bacterium]|nr:membrane dipeptidase [Chloroflexota bacterium]MCI0580616.1 membrane dipeptidase [Chloroflexota bacterium]MCI0649720.1 membrane dipeptidase [Chloroflexota bacterium]MCI0727768.1 membrane dipeptidase [Chloroflexota bacterium]
MFIVDAHLDLAYNALRYGRDLLQPVAEIRQAESKKPGSEGMATVSFPTLRQGGVGLVFGTLFVGPAGHSLFKPGEPMVYSTPDEAHQLAQQQLDYYHRLADDVDYIRLVTDLTSLEEVLASHQDGQEPLLGIVPLMEGADPIRQPAEAELWYERGLRLVGPAWDDTRYSPGAWRSGGGLTKEGRHLLEMLAGLGIILDLTHMSEEASLQALDSYEGRIVASHSNARALVPSARQLGDLQIRRVAERDGVIGIVLCNSFLKGNHPRGGPKHEVTLEHVLAHVDYICQLVGDANHVGIGSDFDGGFGVNDIPAELNSSADLRLVGEALKTHGYSEADVANVMGGNWLTILRAALPG